MDDVLMRGLDEGKVLAVICYLAILFGIVWLLGCVIVGPFLKDKDE
jgi:hypothetical protein